ncbi:MAG: pilus assembly protein TadG-related protein, partial [Planctomycetota bacterium]
MIRSNQRGNANGRQRQAAMLVLIIVLLVGFLIAVALTIDTAQMHLSRTQLRTATDAAAKA